MKSRIRGRALIVAMLLAAGVTFPSGGATGSCAGPRLELAQTSGARPGVRPGAPLSVKGSWFVDGCDDTGGGSDFGCGGPVRETERAQKGVKLELVQGDRRWTLGSADAGTASSGSLGQVAWSVQLPDGVRRGPAVLEAGDARLPVQVGRR